MGWSPWKGQEGFEEVGVTGLVGLDWEVTEGGITGTCGFAIHIPQDVGFLGIRVRERCTRVRDVWAPLPPDPYRARGESLKPSLPFIF